MPHYDERKVAVAGITLYINLYGKKGARTKLARERRIQEALRPFGADERRAVGRVVKIAEEFSHDGELFKVKFCNVVKGAIHSRNSGMHRMVA